MGKKSSVLLVLLCMSSLLCLGQNSTPSSSPQGGTQNQIPSREISGYIFDDKNEPLEGVTVTIKGSKKATVTKANGMFTISATDKDVLVITHVGHETAEMEVVANKRNYVLTLKPAVKQMGEVVVTSVNTGLYNRKIESFTGSASIYSGKELKTVGNQNIIQSLKALDPSFLEIENSLAGSNPNKLPDLEIRGKSSIVGLKDEYSDDPNQPLFILDGFETSLRTIVDLDMNRVASIVILKDAAASAIYGSKAANGVVVVETKAPVAGKLQVSVVSDNTIAFPDLSVYNMMNASEKLEFERLSGRYDVTAYVNPPSFNATRQVGLDNEYAMKLKNVLAGVNTYWLSKPLNTVAISPTISLSVTGGDANFQYRAGLKYGRKNGIMKESGRNVTGADINLMYRSGILKIQNNFSVNAYSSEESPYGSFTNFANANPYYAPLGNDEKYLFYYKNPATEIDVKAPNPMYEASLGNYSTQKQTQLVNNTSVILQLTNEFRFTTDLGLIKGFTKSEAFTSAKSSVFDDAPQKGEFSYSNNELFVYDLTFKGTYGKTFNRIHQINAVLGAKIREDNSTIYSYAGTNFPMGYVPSPAFASEYPDDGRPGYNHPIKRASSIFGNFNYGLYSKYLLDFTYRKDGSSVFGSNRRWTNTWTVGLAWNLEKEQLFKQLGWVNRFKLRGSIGNPGNQNFESYNTYTSFKYMTNIVNPFGLGTIVNQWGNDNLPWQKSVQKTIGTDISLLKDRISLVLDLYSKYTDPLIANIGVPTSTGTPNSMIQVGNLLTKGYDFKLVLTPLYYPEKRFFTRLTFSGKHSRSKYDGLGNLLESMNKGNEASVDRNTQLTKFRDGASPYDIWAVRSLGIDPTTGKEIMVAKDNRQTFQYSASDIVVVGCADPDLTGIIGINTQYKGFNVNLVMRYSTGADKFNNAVYEKVDNINRNTLNYNQDKRALYNRWHQPGDIAAYRKIEMSNYNKELSHVTSRFVERENFLAGEVISVGYELPESILKKLKLTRLTINGYINDIFRISTMKTERGIDYPFERSFSFSINVNF